MRDDSPRDPQHLTLRRVSALALLPPETCAGLMAEEVAADRAGKEADAAEAKQMLDEVREQGHDEARRRRGARYDGVWRVMTTRARASTRKERCIILQYSTVYYIILHYTTMRHHTGAQAHEEERRRQGLQVREQHGEEHLRARQGDHVQAEDCNVMPCHVMAWHVMSCAIR